MSDFGKAPNGEVVKKFKLTNSNGLSMEVINYGAIITNLYVPDSSGSLKDVVLGFNDFNNYYENNPYFGAIIGRYGNRISNGTFLLDGVRYELEQNNGLILYMEVWSVLIKYFGNSSEKNQIINLYISSTFQKIWRKASLEI